MTDTAVNEISSLINNNVQYYFNKANGEYYAFNDEISLRQHIYDIMIRDGYVPTYTCKVSIDHWLDCSDWIFITICYKDKAGIKGLYNYPVCKYKELEYE